MDIGDLVVLLHSPKPVLGVVVKLGGDEDEDYWDEDWLAIQFVNENGPGLFMRMHLKLWTDTDTNCPG